MKNKITATELNEFLASHKLWVETNGKQGNRANLSRAELSRADLNDANLEGANLEGANVLDANLVDANLKGANLTGANLYRADLTGTILEKKTVQSATEVKTAECSGIRSELEELAKKHGMKIDSITLSFL